LRIQFSNVLKYPFTVLDLLEHGSASCFAERHQRKESKMASGTVDPWYLSLLGLAENFRTSNPPNIKLCIHCLQTVFTFKPPPRIETRTHLQLGTVLFTHTKNLDLARFHLETAVSLIFAM